MWCGVTCLKIMSSFGSCDYGPCTVQLTPCSANGVCTNGTCVCSPGFSGDGYYFAYRDCHINLATTTAFASTTLVFASISLLLSVVVLVTHLLRRSKSTSTKISPAKQRTQRILVIVYVRAIAAAACSILLESSVVTSDPLLMFEQPGPSIIYRSIFPWLIIGGTFYVVEWLVLVLPLQFLNTKRESSAGKSTATKNLVLKWFSTHYFYFDILYFIQFCWLGVLSMYPNGPCGCWCKTVIELSVGWACLLPLLFFNAAAGTLLGMIYKEKEKKISCCKLMCLLLGFQEISALWGKKAKDLILLDSSKGPHFRIIRMLHIAVMVAGYGAILTCTLVATVRPLEENPEIFVELTMMLAHFFYITCIVGISGADLPCRTQRTVVSSRSSRTTSSSSGDSRVSSTQPIKLELSP